MTKTTTGWVVFVGCIGMMFGLLAVDIAALDSWNAVMKPVFVGTFLGHISVVIAAFVAGKIIPEDRGDNPQGRISDSNLKVILTEGEKR